MQRHPVSEHIAQQAAGLLRRYIGSDHVDLGMVLGSGWSNSLQLEDSTAIPLSTIPGFGGLQELEGHPRQLVMGWLRGKRVAMLRGRVHLNEAPANPHVYRMVRLQIEMLCQLGVQTFILTCAAGSLTDTVAPGSLVLMDGFCTLYAPPMPLFAGEFVSPEDALDADWRGKLLGHPVGGYAMLLGPWFEGRRYDKALLAATGCKTVGMSVVPEACVAALYGGRVLGVANVTNSAVEEHSHETNVARAQAASERLGRFLTEAIVAAP